MQNRKKETENNALICLQMMNKEMREYHDKGMCEISRRSKTKVLIIFEKIFLLSCVARSSRKCYRVTNNYSCKPHLRFV